MALLNLTLTKFVKWGYPVRSMHIHGIAKLNTHKICKMGIPSQKYAYSWLLNLTLTKIAKWGYPVKGFLLYMELLNLAFIKIAKWGYPVRSICINRNCFI